MGDLYKADPDKGLDKMIKDAYVHGTVILIT